MEHTGAQNKIGCKEENSFLDLAVKNNLTVFFHSQILKETGHPPAPARLPVAGGMTRGTAQHTLGRRGVPESCLWHMATPNFPLCYLNINYLSGCLACLEPPPRLIQLMGVIAAKDLKGKIQKI